MGRRRRGNGIAAFMQGWNAGKQIVADYNDAVLKQDIGDAAKTDQTQDTTATMTEKEAPAGSFYDESGTMVTPAADGSFGDGATQSQPQFDSVTTTTHKLGDKTQATPFSQAEVDSERLRRIGDVYARAGKAEEAMKLRQSALQTQAAEMAIKKGQREEDSAVRMADIGKQMNDLTQQQDAFAERGGAEGIIKAADAGAEKGENEPLTDFQRKVIGQSYGLAMNPLTEERLMRQAVASKFVEGDVKGSTELQKTFIEKAATGALSALANKDVDGFNARVRNVVGPGQPRVVSFSTDGASAVLSNGATVPTEAIRKNIYTGIDAKYGVQLQMNETSNEIKKLIADNNNQTKGEIADLRARISGAGKASGSGAGAATGAGGFKDYEHIRKELDGYYQKEGQVALPGPDGKPAPVDMMQLRNTAARYLDEIAKGSPNASPGELMAVADARAKAELSSIKPKVGEPGYVSPAQDKTGQWKQTVTGFNGRQYATGVQVNDDALRQMGVPDEQIRAASKTRAALALKGLDDIRKDPAKSQRYVDQLGGGEKGRAAFEQQYQQALGTVQRMKELDDKATAFAIDQTGPTSRSQAAKAAPIRGATAQETTAAREAGVVDQGQAARDYTNRFSEGWRGLKQFVSDQAGSSDVQAFPRILQVLREDPSRWANPGNSKLLARAVKADPSLLSQLTDREMQIINGATNGALR